MELKAKYEELSCYIQKRFGQPVSLSQSEGGTLQVTYTKHVFIKDLKINIRIRVEEVMEDTVVLGYETPLGLDKVISGALSFIAIPGIYQEGNRVRICLSEIEKTKPVVKNIALCAITPEADGLRIDFRLKV